MQLIGNINRVFAILARQHYVLYIAIGFIPAYLFVSNVGQQEKINIFKSWGSEIVFFSVLICVLYGCFIFLFYGRAGKYSRVTRYGFVVKDLYFPTKISSNISYVKKASGYFYVIFRVAHSMLHGFAAGVALFMLESMNFQ